jgi:hypothetical protein
METLIVSAKDWVVILIGFVTAINDSKVMNCSAPEESIYNS